MPGTRDHVLATCAIPTVALERANPNHIGRDIITNTDNPQQMISRPRTSRNPRSTRVPGMYPFSPATPPGTRVHGMCGYCPTKFAMCNHR